MPSGDQSSDNLGRSGPFSRIGLALLIFLCLIFVSSYSSRFLRKAQVEHEIREWEQEIAYAEQRQLDLEAYLKFVNSPAYVEAEARKMGYAKPGDKVFSVLQGTARSPVDAADSAVGPTLDQPPRRRSGLAPGPVWQQWLSIFHVDE